MIVLDKPCPLSTKFISNSTATIGTKENKSHCLISRQQLVDKTATVMAKENKSQCLSLMQQLIGDMDEQKIIQGNLKNILDMDNHKTIESVLNLDEETDKQKVVEGDINFDEDMDIISNTSDVFLGQTNPFGPGNASSINPATLLLLKPQIISLL